MKHKRELPSAEEAVAYADGYLEGLHDAKEHDVARLIIERDAALSKIAFERVLRQAAERSRDELRACAAELYEQIGTLRAERDALKAEVERMKERNAEHEARFDAESSRADHYKAEVERKDKALVGAFEFAGRARGTALGLAISGKDNPKLDSGLMKLHEDGLEVERTIRAALSPAKAGG